MKSINLIIYQNEIFVIASFIGLIIYGTRYIKKMGFSNLITLISTLGMMLILGVTLITSNIKYGICTYTITYYFLIFLLLVLTYHDIKNRELPVEWLLIGGLIGCFLSYYISLGMLIERILCSIIFAIGLLILSKVFKGGIGSGDAYVFVVVSLLMGWEMTLSILIFSFVLAGLLGFVLVILKKANRKTTMPLMPFVLFTTVIIIWF